MNENYGLIHQVYSLPELIRSQYADLEPKSRSILATPEIFKIFKVYITGCGDSYAAALAVQDSFSKLTGLEVEAIPAIELSRTVSTSNFGNSPMNPLVIAVSNSGSVVRMNEAIMRATQHGAFSLAVTGNRQSPLAQSASRVFDLDVPSFEAAPGTRSYVVSLLALLLIAIRIGEVKGRYTMDTAMDMRYDILRQADNLEEILPTIDEQMKKLAEDWKNMEAFDFVGTGMEFGSAWYCHAKILEMIGKYSFFKNSEDWLHTNLFLRKNTTTATVVFADERNNANSRTQELISYAKQLERPLLIIGNKGVITPQTTYFQSSCLTDFVPVNILANYIANLIGEEDGRGCKDVWSIADGAKCIRCSEVVIL